MLFDQPLADLAVDGGLLEHLERQLAAGRFALGVVRLDGRLEGLARHVHRPHAADRHGEPLRGEHEVGRRLQVVFGQHDP